MRRVIGITVLVCGVTCGVAFGEPAQRYRNPALVCVRLTMTDQLSGPAFITAKEEATRIWDRHGIALNWAQPASPKPGEANGEGGPAGTTCRTVVPILFDERAMLKETGGSHADALGLTVFHGRSQTVYVSVSRAFKMLGQSSHFDKAVGSQGERDYRGGVLIGRVVAHELGHVLLTSMAHTEDGLMRPVFGLRDVLSPDDKTTDLSPIETNRLVMRFALIPFDPAAEERAVLARADTTR